MKSNSVNLFFSKGYLSQLHPKRDQNPLFVPETASISDLFIYKSPHGFRTSAILGRFAVLCTVSS